MKPLKFDIMLRGRFVCTMSYHYPPHCPFPLNSDELEAFIESRRPSLRGQPYQIAFYPR